MKGRSRRFMAMLLVCSMSFGLLFSGNVFAAENSGTETETATQTEDAKKLDTAAGEDLTDTDKDVAVYTREQMTQEETVITGNFEFAGGDGTETNPYQVATAEQLDAIRNNMTAHYIQTADINLAGMEWEPIGGKSLDEEEARIFTGSFDGGGYEIQNMTITDGGKQYIGLFGISTGIISNVCLTDCKISISLDYTLPEDNICIYVGSIAGANVYEDVNGETDSCSVNGSISLDNADELIVGGIIGEGACSNSTNRADINVLANDDAEDAGHVYCGGIIGQIGTVNTPINNCVNYGEISASADSFVDCGGISGCYGAIDYCVNYGNISGNIIAYRAYGSFAGNCNVGGIVGANSSDTNSNCINYGNVYAITNCAGDNGLCYAGGYAGHIGYYRSGTISNCYNLGQTIRASNGIGITGMHSKAGRISGHVISDKTSDCYSYDRTLVNGEIPTEDIGTDQINGESMTLDQINTAIEPILDTLHLPTTRANFTLGIDNLFFTNDPMYFMTADELDVWYDMKDKSSNEKYAEHLMGTEVSTNYQISDERFNQLTHDMNPDVMLQLALARNGTWNGSCYGMSILMALRFSAPDLLPLSAIAPDDEGIQNTWDLLAPAYSEDTENVVNYYQLMYNYPAIVNRELLLSKQTEENYELAVENFLETLKDDGVPTVISICDSTSGGAHAVIAFEIISEEEDYYSIKVYDPVYTEFQMLKLYKNNASTFEDEGINYTALRIEYRGYNCLYNYVSDTDMMDLRNYVDSSIDHTSQYGENSYLNPSVTTRNTTDVILNSDKEELVYKDGKFQTFDNAFGPFADVADGPDGSNMHRFILDTTTPADEYSLTLGAETNECMAQMNMISWAAAASAEANKLNIEMDNLEQSIETISDTATDISAMITYKNVGKSSVDTLAIDTSESQNLLLSVKDNDVLITGDHLADSLIVIERDGKIYSTDYDGKSNTILVSLDSSDNITVRDVTSDGNHVYGEPEFTWSDDYSSCTATFTCADGDDQQIVECVVTSKDNGDGTVTYTAVAEFNGKSYTAETVVDIKEEPNEKPDGGKPAESGTNNNSENSTDVNDRSSENKTSEESVSNVQTGDASILLLWSLLIASMISAGVIVHLIRKKYRK